MTAIKILDTPVGPMGLAAKDGAITAVHFGELEGDETNDPALDQAARQLDEYFRGKRKDFELPLSAEGTEFERAVWGALAEIPFGETRSYLDIAKRIGNTKAVRAVGRANGKNPLAIVVPCHRVIGANGALTGFGGGMEAKRWLLDHEFENRYKKF
jgi:methylated-DNA-[protein]-cysteine S-methyltransferase